MRRAIPPHAALSTTSQKVQYKAKGAINAGYTVHTLSVGANSDADLMEAIAFASGGEFINVPGGTTIAALEADLRLAFKKVAANVPPAKLLVERE